MPVQSRLTSFPRSDASVQPSNDNLPPRKAPSKPDDPSSLGGRQLLVIGVGVLVLIAALYWMAEGMQSLSRQEICLESHARNCTPVDKAAP